jgi:hypothetical protein
VALEGDSALTGFLELRAMSFDPKPLMGDTVAQFEALLKVAYERGYEKGVQDGIDRLAQLARGPQAANDVRVPDEKLTAVAIRRVVEKRAPRGLVPKVVAAMLRDNPGMTITDYEQMLYRYDGQVSAKSIGNELRRHEGRKYRRNESGEWFPMSGNKEAGEGRETNSPASDLSSQGEPLWNRLNQ